MTLEVYGKTKLCEIKDLPGILRKAAEKIQKKANPHTQTYNSDDLEKALKIIKEEAEIVYIKVRV